jgi:hypothetical protein
MVTFRVEDVLRLITEAGPEGVTRKELAVLLGVKRESDALHIALTSLARDGKIDHDRTSPVNGPMRFRACQ